MLPPPLHGIRILAVEQYGAGPFGSLYLADLGAEVIKVEPPPGPGGKGGDTSRQSGPYFLGDNDSQFFQTFNRGKRSLTLNLKTEEGKAIFHRLVAGSDAVMNNLRGDQPGKLGLTYEALGPVNPSIVCVHLSGYGRTGERASWPGYDYLMQAEAGFMSVTGEPDGPPSRMGLSIIDYMTGITAALSLTAGLLGAAKTGKGRDLDVSLFDVAMHQLSYPATWYLNEGVVTGRRPRSGHPSVVPTEWLPTRDGQVFVMCILPKFWENLCHAVGRPDLIDDPRFIGAAERHANRDALMDIIDPITRTRTTAEWMQRFAGQVPAAPVLDMQGALDNPYFRDRGGVDTVEHQDLPGMQLLASPIHIDGKRPYSAAGPKLGADTDAILDELSFDAEAIADLKARGVV